MGKCLSCCDPENELTHNGHPGSSGLHHSPTPKPTGTTVMMSPSVILSCSAPPYSSSPQQLQSHSPISSNNQHKPKPPPLRPGSAELILSKPQTNGDNRKMFNPYPKLPPIRKPSAGSESGSLPGSGGTAGGGRWGSSATPPGIKPGDISKQKINVMFELYKDPDEDSILADGIESLCRDLDVRPEEFRVLVLAYKFEAETMCRFTRHEFHTGCSKLRVDSIKAIKLKFGDMLAEVDNKANFKEFYRWTYKFGLDTDVGQRTLPVDMAIGLWRLVFSRHQPSILKRWLLFLEKHTHIRGIPKDTWDMFLNFSETVGEDLSNYDDTEAWPSLFDDFVEYENDRQNQNLTPDKDAEPAEVCE